MTSAEIEIPKTYKACIYDDPGKISTKVVELETPEPGNGQVLVHLYVSFSPPGAAPKSNAFKRANVPIEHIPASAIRIWAS